jgi:hypothetical protein
MRNPYDFCNLNADVKLFSATLGNQFPTLRISPEQLSIPHRARLGNRGRNPLVAAKQAPEPPNTRLSVGDYIADILLDARPDGTIYHWIVQRVGSAAIIHWGQEYTFEDAYSTVSDYLADLNDTDKKKA